MSAVVGTLLINLMAKTAQFQSGLKEAKGGVTTFAKDVTKTAEGAGSQLGNLLLPGGVSGLMAPALGAMAVVGIARHFKELALGMHETEIQAHAMNMELDTFLGWERSLRNTTVSMDQVGTATNKLASNIGKATAGEKGQKDALAELGFGAASFAGLTKAESFQAVAGAIAALPSPFERARLEIQLFGKAGAALDPVLKKLAAGPQNIIPKFATKALAETGQDLKDLGHLAKDTATLFAGIAAWAIQSVLPGGPARHKWQEQRAAEAERTQELARLMMERKALLEKWHKEIDEIGLTDAQKRMTQLKELGAPPEELAKGEAINRWIEAQTRIASNIKTLTDLTKEWRLELQLVGEKGEHLRKYITAIGGRQATVTGTDEQREAWLKAVTENLTLAKAMDRMQFGEKLREQMAAATDPLHTFKKEMEELNRALTTGAILASEYGPMAKALRDRAVKGLIKTEPTFAPALMQGTQEALSAINRYNLGAEAQDFAKQQVQLTAEGLRLQAEVVALLAAQNDKLGVLAPVNLKPVGIAP